MARDIPTKKGGSARPHNMPAKPQGGRPGKRREPAKTPTRNNPMNKPGDGTRGTGRPAH